MAEALAGGYRVGDRVLCRGLPGTVTGPPARKAVASLSVAVRYDDGRCVDERTTFLTSLEVSASPDEVFVDDSALADGLVDPGAPLPRPGMAPEAAAAGRTPGAVQGVRFQADASPSTGVGAGRTPVPQGMREPAYGAPPPREALYNAPPPRQEPAYAPREEQSYGTAQLLKDPVYSRGGPPRPEVRPGARYREEASIYLEGPKPSGALVPGDRVLCRGEPATVLGNPSRASCIGLSLALRFDSGRISDERIANITPLQAEGPEVPPLDLQAQEELSDRRADNFWGGEAAVESQAGAGRMPAMPGGPSAVGAMRPGSMGGAMGALPAAGGGRVGAMPPPTRTVPPGVRVAAPEEAWEEQPLPPGAEGFLPEEDAQQPPLPPPGGYEEDELIEGVSPLQMSPEAPVGGGVPMDDSDVYAAVPPGAASPETALLEKIQFNFPDLSIAFRALDRNNTGYVSRADFFQAMADVFLTNGFREEDVYDASDVFNLNEDGYLSYGDFMAIAQGAGVVPSQAGMLPDQDQVNVTLAIQKFKASVEQRFSSMREAFRSLDTSRKSVLTGKELEAGFRAHGVALAPEELEQVLQQVDPVGSGAITYTTFCQFMNSRHRPLR